MKKQFPIGAVLSIVGEKLMAPISDVYAILNYMTGDNLYTHQLPRVARECRPFLLRQHPQLSDWNDVDVTGDNYAERLADAVERYGEFLDVEPLPNGEHERIDPISELAEKVHPDKIIVCAVGEEKGETK